MTKKSAGAKESADLPSKSSSADVENFLHKVAATPVTKAAGRGRLMFVMDATASREPTWDLACDLQARMFAETDTLGGLDVQLVYYRGFGECRASKWVSNTNDLVGLMTRVRCLAGRTQLAKVLRHAIKENDKQKVGALVFVGDCFEEDVDKVGDIAGRLGLAGVRAFMFHEGHDPLARRAFQQIAHLTGGAYSSFDAGSAAQLRELLSAVAVYAAGGRTALIDYGKRTGGAALQITHQVR